MRTALDSKHTIVIGGGLAGLTATTYLARAGQRVTVLEKAQQPGGRAITDTPHGFTMNRGAHGLYTGDAASEVLNELRISYTHGSPKNIKALDARGVHRFPGDAMSLFQTSLLSAAEKLELLGIFTRLSTLNPQRYNQQSVQQWLDANTRRPRVRAVLEATARVSLYTSALDVASADTFIARLQQSAKHPIHYVEGGWQTLVNGLEQAARDADATIRTSANVSSLDFRDNRITAVNVHDGTQLPATDVLIALPLQDAHRLLSNTPLENVLAPAIDGSLPVPIACLDLALSSLPCPQHPVVIDVQHPYFLTVQSEFARLAPQGGAVAHCFKQIDPRDPGDPHLDRADLERFMDRVQPGWRERVVECHFLPRISGSSVLPLAASGGMLGRAWHHLESATNVYFAGDWVGPRGWLVDVTMASARAAVRSILGAQPAQMPVARAA
jgi:phytoene dehydrogenase-like protein